MKTKTKNYKNGQQNQVNNKGKQTLNKHLDLPGCFKSHENFHTHKFERCK